MNRIRNGLTGLLVLWLVSVSAVANPLPAKAGPAPLVWAILTYEDHDITRERWQPILDEINRKLRGKATLELALLDFSGLEQAVRNHEVDFVMTNAAMYVELSHTYGMSPPLLSAVMHYRGTPLRGMGGVIVVRDGPGEPRQLQDLKRHRVAFPGPYSFGGYLIQLQVLNNAGVNTAQLQWLPTGMRHVNAIEALLEKRADVAFVRTGVLENMRDRGLISPRNYRVLNDQNLSSFPQKLSTQLYPEWPVSAMSHVRPQQTAWVTGAFLSLDGASLDILHRAGIKNFSMPADYAVVEQLMREMRVRPFHIIPPLTFADLWRDHKLLLLLLLLFVLVASGLSVRLLLGNRRLRAALIALRLSKQELQVSAVAFQTSEAILIVDENECILDVNRSFTAITGYERHEVLGQTPRIFHSGRHDKAFYQALWQSIRMQGFWRGEVWNRKKDGTIIPLYQQITAVRDSSGVVSHYVSSFSDITLRKEIEERVRKLAHYDVLTGTANRRLMVQHIQHALEQSAHEPLQHALLFIDFDHFKQLNDALGYEAGDNLLRQAAVRIEARLGGRDSLGRLAGDDFVVLLNAVGQNPSEALNHVQQMAQAIQEAVSGDFLLAGQCYSMTASIGISLFGDNRHTAEELLQQAEMAMYQAKAEGRYTVCFFDPAMQDAAVRKHRMESDLRAAIAAGQFVLYYQPKIEAGGELHGYEALLRWQLPDGRMVSPAEFIPLAEETGLIIPIGLWVIREAVAQIRRWQQQPGMEHLVLAINVSARQFRHEDLVDDIRQAIAQAGIPGQLLELEITESMLLDNYERVSARMQALQELGVRFALDDFGTGYSSLTYLKKLPLSCLKIDQSFVRDMLDSSDDTAIVETIISLAKTLRLQVVAEGVETAGQAEFLCTLGCDLLQGYYFGRPGPLPTVSGG